MTPAVLLPSLLLLLNTCCSIKIFIAAASICSYQQLPWLLMLSHQRTSQFPPTATTTPTDRAKGACQQTAAPNNAPCPGEMYSGFGSCTAWTFQSYFNEAATMYCTQNAQSVTGVTPGTRSWAYPFSGPSVPTAVSPGSVIGGAIGAGIGNRIDPGIGGLVGSVIGAEIGNSVDRAAINTVSSWAGSNRRLLREVKPKHAAALPVVKAN